MYFHAFLGLIMYKAFNLSSVAFIFVAGCSTIDNQNKFDEAKILSIGRSTKEIERDASRKPIEILKFAQIKNGQKIVDYVPGTGYFTRIFSNAIGEKGSVTALTPQIFIDTFAKGIIPQYANEGGFKNINSIASNDDNLNIPKDIDVFFTAQNYHDIRIYLKEGTTNKLNKAVYDALKTGGYYIIIDHSGKANLDEEGIKKLHRIDMNTIIKEVEAVGFKLDSKSEILRNPNDDLSLNVFDPNIRGKTDQFILRFKKS